MKITLSFILLFFATLSFSQIDYGTSFDLALKKAKEEGKLVFVKYYGETCSHCQKLQEMLSIDSVSKLYNKNFISVKINAENLQPSDFAFINRYNFRIDGVPMMFFFTSNGDFIHFASPKLEVSNVINVVTNCLDSEKRTSSLPIKYKAGARDMYTLKMYSKLAQLVGNDTLVDALANDIYTNFDKANFLSENSIVSVAKYVKSIDNGLFVFWMKNYSKLDSVAPHLTMLEKEKVFKDILIDDINTHKKQWNLEQLELAKKYLEITHFPNPLSFIWEEEFEIYSVKKQEKEALNVVKAMIESSDFEMANYVFKTVVPKLTKKESYLVMESWFPNLEKKYTRPEHISQIYLSKLLLYKLSKDEVKLKKVKKEAENYFSTNGFSLDLIAEVLK